jgi:hypothetical protein
LLLRGIIRASKFVDAKINLERAHAARQKGDYLTASTSLLGAVSSIATFLNACFATGTKLLTKRGWLPIEQLVVGDEVWNKPEHEPGHPGGWKQVEELFVRTGRIWHLHAGGQVIRTTGEHPFYVVGKGCGLRLRRPACGRPPNQPPLPTAGAGRLVEGRGSLVPRRAGVGALPPFGYSPSPVLG